MRSVIVLVLLVVIIPQTGAIPLMEDTKVMTDLTPETEFWLEGGTNTSFLLLLDEGDPFVCEWSILQDAVSLGIESFVCNYDTHLEWNTGNDSIESYWYCIWSTGMEVTFLVPDNDSWYLVLNNWDDSPVYIEIETGFDYESPELYPKVFNMTTHEGPFAVTFTITDEGHCFGLGNYSVYLFDETVLSRTFSNDYIFWLRNDTDSFTYTFESEGWFNFTFDMWDSAGNNSTQSYCIRISGWSTPPSSTTTDQPTQDTTLTGSSPTPTGTGPPSQLVFLVVAIGSIFSVCMVVGHINSTRKRK